MNKYLIGLEKHNFEKHLLKLNKKVKNKKVLLYGAGILFNVIDEYYDLSNLNIVAISDLKFDKEGVLNNKYKTIPIKEIEKYNPDYIFVSTVKYEPIIKNLKKNVLPKKRVKIEPLVHFSLKEKTHKFFKFNSKTTKLEQEIKTLHYIINTCIDIKKIPKTTGILKQRQDECTKILNDVEKICTKNKLKYWFDSGTLLGAYRHKGFVPWDDDIDICMLREDYNKILPVLKEKFKNSNYIVREYLESKKFFQIRILNKFNGRIGLDIFPVDYYYRGDLSELEKIRTTKEILKARKLLDKKYSRKFIVQKKFSQVKKDIDTIQNKIINKNNKPKTKKPALFFGIDFPYNVKGSLIMDWDMIFPLKKMKFEEKTYCVPNKTQEYLENIYGDINSFPELINLERVKL